MRQITYYPYDTTDHDADPTTLSLSHIEALQEVSTSLYPGVNPQIGEAILYAPAPTPLHRPIESQSHTIHE